MMSLSCDTVPLSETVESSWREQMNRRRDIGVALALVVLAGVWAGPASAEEGSLVGLSMDSQVGVVLDELPASQRARVANALIAKPASFWQNRARAQVRLATYRLVFRE